MGTEGVNEIRDKPLRKFRGEGGSGLARYLTTKYKISIIISPKCQYIFCLFPQKSARISNSNRSCTLIHLFCHYNDIYLGLFAFESHENYLQIQDLIYSN